jgi:hypothetical protein
MKDARIDASLMLAFCSSSIRARASSVARLRVVVLEGIERVKSLAD